MKEIITFFIVFIIVYLLYLFLIILNKKRISKYKNSNYVTFLVNRYNLDIDKLPIKKVANIISLANSFIISFTFAIVMIIDNNILRMILALAIIIPLMLFIYHLIGKSLQKKYSKKL